MKGDLSAAARELDLHVAFILSANKARIPEGIRPKGRYPHARGGEIHPRSYLCSQRPISKGSILDTLWSLTLMRTQKGCGFSWY